MESFDQDGFKNNLATVLGETVSPSMITLAVAVASVRVTAEIATNLTMRQAQSTIAATLEAQTTESLSSALGVTVVAMEPPAVVPVSVVESSDTAALSSGASEEAAISMFVVVGGSLGGLALIIILIGTCMTCLPTKSKGAAKLKEGGIENEEAFTVEDADAILEDLDQAEAATIHERLEVADKIARRLSHVADAAVALDQSHGTPSRELPAAMRLPPPRTAMGRVSRRFSTAASGVARRASVVAPRRSSVTPPAPTSLPANELTALRNSVEQLLQTREAMQTELASLPGYAEHEHPIRGGNRALPAAHALPDPNSRRRSQMAGDAAPNARGQNQARRGLGSSKALVTRHGLYSQPGDSPPGGSSGAARQPMSESPGNSGRSSSRRGSGQSESRPPCSMFL